MREEILKKYEMEEALFLHYDRIQKSPEYKALIEKETTKSKVEAASK